MKCLIAFLLAIACLKGRAQTTDSIPAPQQRPAFLEQLQRIGQSEAKSSIEKYESGRISLRQDRLIQEIKRTEERARIYLRGGIDTLQQRSFLDRVNHSLEIALDGITVHTGSVQTQRNLEVGAAIIQELIGQLEKQKAVSDLNLQHLLDLRNQVDSLSSDSALYTFPNDSLASVRYIRKLAAAAREIGPVDSALTHTLEKAQETQTEILLLSYKLRSSLDDITKERKERSATSFKRDFVNLWDHPVLHKSFRDTLLLSVRKEYMTLHYYLRNNSGLLALLILLTLISTRFLATIKKKYREEKGGAEDHLVLRYPLLSGAIIVISLFQFMFLEPPFVFQFVLWMIAAVCLTKVFHGFITPYWMRFWTTMLLFCFLGGLDNAILQASRPERWLLLALSLSGTVFGAHILLTGKHAELKEKGILYFVFFVTLFQSLSVLCNIFGRYNLSKTLMISGFTGVVIAILFLWTVRLINEGLAVTSTVYKHPDRKLFYIDFNRIGERVPRFAYFLLVVGWLILVGRQFYAYQQFADSFKESLNTERTLGDYTFTINGLFFFLLILACALILSQIISFFSGEPADHNKPGNQARKPGLGSWLLLIRIFIITVGLFLAFAAAGIPIDRLTIVLGALGVGIGLGLQGLVNNLISGLIIAFEKPVNVGDIIEVGGKPGTMKSIGFRSSVVSLPDGSCLIIPNGDLLGQHLINWTMNRGRRRLSITVGVAYGSDLQQVKKLLGDLLEKDERILNIPAPVVAAKEFGDSAVNFEILFWINHISETLSIRNEILMGIDRSFREAGISIPFPQHDLHIIRDGN